MYTSGRLYIAPEAYQAARAADVASAKINWDQVRDAHVRLLDAWFAGNANLRRVGTELTIVRIVIALAEADTRFDTAPNGMPYQLAEAIGQPEPQGDDATGISAPFTTKGYLRGFPTLEVPITSWRPGELSAGRGVAAALINAAGIEPPGDDPTAYAYREKAARITGALSDIEQRFPEMLSVTYR
jgi:hypothetical protein